MGNSDKQTEEMPQDCRAHDLEEKADKQFFS